MSAERSPSWWLVWLCLIVTPVILAGMIGFWVDLNRKSDREIAQFRLTQRQLIGFHSLVTQWAIDHDKGYPGPTLEDALRAMQEDEGVARELWRRCPLVLRGEDAWGRPLIYRTSQRGKRAVIRSTGPNGKDERGHGDDIQSQMRFPCDESYEFSPSAD